jgi:putative DNA primase/helicase
LTGILNWSLDGLARLVKQGRFTRPKATDDALATLQELASPVAAFVRDLCEVEPEHEIPVEELWRVWREWAEDNGHGKGGTKQLFGRNLRAALPQLKLRRLGTDEQGRERVYEGLRLKVQP